jgi:hypothetical protein
MTKQSMPAPLELSITNEIADILGSNKICVRIEFDKSTHAVISNSVHFSIDTPEIAVLEWACTQRPNVQFLANFKRGKKVFLEPFNYEIKIKVRPSLDKPEEHNLIDILKNSNLYTYCITIDKNGRANSVSVCKPFATSMSATGTSAIGTNFINMENSKSILAPETINTLTSLAIQTSASNFKQTKNYQKFGVARENVILDRVTELLNLTTNKLNNFRQSLNLLYLYFFIIFLLLFLILFQRTRIKLAFTKEPRRFLFFCWLILTYFMLKNMITPHMFYAGLAGMFAPISFYYIFGAKTDSFSDKLKSLIGFILAATIIPLLLKAFLIFKNL